MASDEGRFPWGNVVDLADIEGNLRAVIAQLDDAGQMLAAAYVELALGVLLLDGRRSPPPPFDEPA